MRYVAKIKSVRVTSVNASNEDMARGQILDQLSKPGRYPIRKQWIDAGMVVVADRPAPKPTEDMVDSGEECPKCGEGRVDWLLVKEVNGCIHCQTCGNTYWVDEEDECGSDRDAYGFESYIPELPDYLFE